jgi:SAM-dependent methyltransferase
MPTTAGLVWSAERISLLQRTLQISEDVWRATLGTYAAALPSPVAGEDVDGELSRCLGTLAAAYKTFSPHASTLVPNDDPARPCPACGLSTLRPFLLRGRPPEALCYARCDRCGHGALWNAQEITAEDVRARYSDKGYYQKRDQQGAGYDGYADEADYRENKGARLIDRFLTLPGQKVRNLLEVGSGYGFTRAAADRAGLTSAGVDLNGQACAEAQRRYGLSTFRGTLEDALATPASGIVAGSWDLILYQFVLEHVVDPIRELDNARLALRAGGWLALLLPSMDAIEIDVFGSSYRSFRADHLLLPSRASLQLLLARAGFQVEVLESTCNLHLFREFLSPEALARIYATGRGPDLFVIARRGS